MSSSLDANPATAAREPSPLPPRVPAAPPALAPARLVGARGAGPGIRLLVLPVLFFLLSGCQDKGKLAEDRARANAVFLAETIAKDVEEVRAGLPEGATEIARALAAEPELEADLKRVQRALHDARRKVQSLRIAKSTFFALADLSGTVLRNDQEQDRMAGKALFGAYPALAAAKERYVEATGALPEAAGVRAPREDAQWVAASPVRVSGVPRALYVTGWSWAAYAYRLEFALRGKIRTEMAGDREQNEPLVYVFVVEGKKVYGAPVSPDVSRGQVGALDPLARAQGEQPFSARLEITGREFGMAVQRVPALGKDVGVVVLRSET